jgi:hypothetical protein
MLKSNEKIILTPCGVSWDVASPSSIGTITAIFSETLEFTHHFLDILPLLIFMNTSLNRRPSKKSEKENRKIPLGE